MSTIELFESSASLRRFPESVVAALCIATRVSVVWGVEAENVVAYAPTDGAIREIDQFMRVQISSRGQEMFLDINGNNRGLSEDVITELGLKALSRPVRAELVRPRDVNIPGYWLG